MTEPTNIRLGIAIYRKADGHILTVGWIASDKFGGYDTDGEKPYKDNIDRFDEHYGIVGNPEWVKTRAKKPTIEELERILSEPDGARGITIMPNGEIRSVNVQELQERDTMTEESYPKSWKHCMIHLNPMTGEMNSDGDHSVRKWIESRARNLEEENERLKDTLREIREVVQAFTDIYAK